MGLVVCVLCALFPPRQSLKRDEIVSHGFLLSSNWNISYGQPVYPKYVGGGIVAGISLNTLPKLLK
jgi:hypothetical protein